MPKKKEEVTEEKKRERSKKNKEKVEKEKIVSQDEKGIIRERIEKGPNGETIRIRERIIEEDDDNDENEYIDDEGSSTTGKKNIMDIITNKKFIIGIAAFVLILVVVMIILVASKPKPIPPYKYVKALKGDLYNSIESPEVTTLVSTTTNKIKAPITGTVREVKYKKGSTVKEGDTLIVLDATFASETVRKLENGISSLEKMLALYQLKNDNLSLEANGDGFITDIMVQKDSQVLRGEILAYYIPTTTFRVEYNVTYDELKKVTTWQTVNVKVAGYDDIMGLVYDIDNSTIDQGYIKVGVYVNNSPINLSGIVSTAEVVTATGNLNSEGTGTFEEIKKIPIYSLEDGKVVSGIFENNKKVYDGNVLFNIENIDISNKIKTYENDLIQLQKEVVQVRSEVNASVVKATSSGIVTSDPVKIGDSTFPNKELVELKTTGLIEADTYVSVNDIQKIEEGNNINKKVIFTITGEKDKYIYGVVKDAEKYNSTDINESYKVTVKVNEADATEDIIGKSVKIEIVLEEETNAIYVPIGALIAEKNYYYLEVKNGSSYLKRQVKIGLETDEYVQILEGINEGETVRMKNPELDA